MTLPFGAKNDLDFWTEKNLELKNSYMNCDP